MCANLSNERRKRYRKLWKKTYGDLFCAYCENICEVATIDHLTPKSKGGTNRQENLVVACLECNQLKGDKILENLSSLKLMPVKKEDRICQ